jgi:hypothetical protein
LPQASANDQNRTAKGEEDRSLASIETGSSARARLGLGSKPKEMGAADLDGAGTGAVQTGKRVMPHLAIDPDAFLFDKTLASLRE